MNYFRSDRVSHDRHASRLTAYRHEVRGSPSELSCLLNLLTATCAESAQTTSRPHSDTPPR